MTTLNDKLYGLVQEYSNLGFHRTGTPVDQATIEWFERQLSIIGARVEKAPYRFQRYAAEWILAVDGQELESLPLFYESAGSFVSSSPYVGAVDVSDPSTMAYKFEEQIEVARRSGAGVAVLSTIGREGLLVVPNRAPVLGSGFPTILAAGSSLEGLQRGSVYVSLSAEIEDSESANVVGYLGEGDFSRPVVVTTPLSGWFHCAGERGTGIAIALELAESLARSYPVMVVGATGHELEYLGAKKYLEANPLQPAAVIHLGASVATGIPGLDRRLVLSPTRHALTSTTGSVAQDMQRAVAQGEFAFESEPPLFGGEGGEWIRLGMPLLSYLGFFRLFHAPEDLPQNATSPELLNVVCSAVVETSHIFVANALEGAGRVEKKA